MSKIFDSAVELNKIQYIAGNNTLNFTATPISGGAPIVDATAGVYANGAFLQANAAFNSANNVAPQIQPAFSTANSAALYANGSFAQANAAFNSANNVAPQIQPAFSTANSAALYANAAFLKANSSLSNTNLNVFGTLRMLNQGGEEGGELFLDKPVTNTSLSAGITIDIYQNKLRIFETGGSIRGAFIDIANTTASGVGSEITKYGSNTTSTGYLAIPQGTTAERPAAAANGHMRYNTTNSSIEAYFHRAGWVTLKTDDYNVDILLVGGGGSGGGQRGGGGGAGGLVYVSSQTVQSRTAYPITIGAGAATPASPTTTDAWGANGSTSTAFSQTALGGGGGGGDSPTYAPGRSGASGGGSSSYSLSSGGAGTPSQGNPGGGGNSPSGNYGAGGGGGAGAAGTPGTSSLGGPGGVGLAYAISGASTYYAGGGGGGSYNSPNTGGAGGSGGGGAAGSYSGSVPGIPGTVNTGGGGGAGTNGSGYSLYGGGGGSGVCIVRYLGTQRGTGGTITNDGTYTIHTFTGSGTFTA